MWSLFCRGPGIQPPKTRVASGFHRDMVRGAPCAALEVSNASRIFPLWWLGNDLVGQSTSLMPLWMAEFIAKLTWGMYQSSLGAGLLSTLQEHLLRHDLFFLRDRLPIDKKLLWHGFKRSCPHILRKCTLLNSIPTVKLKLKWIQHFTLSYPLEISAR